MSDLACNAESLENFLWIVVIGGLTAFIAAFGIGANDVANAYATSVGSKALTIKQACGLAVVFEFAGAVLAGSSVSDTIRKGIADYECFSNGYMDSATLMYGNLCVVGAVAMWLLVASWAEMPVSTTHSCVGGLIGMTIVAKGGSCVVWIKQTEAANLYIPKGVVGIVLSWVISPVLSAFFAVILYTSVRQVILRSRHSFTRAILLYPVLIMLAVWINAFFVISKGIAKKICTKGDESFICFDNGKVKGWVALGFSAAVGFFVAAVCLPIYPHIKKTVNAQFAAKAAKEAADAEAAVSSTDGEGDKAVEMADANPKPTAEAEADKPGEEDNATVGQHIGKAVWVALGTSLNVNPHAAIEEDPTVTRIHNNAEKFDPKTEAVFRYIQIFTAICDSFAHGANDVANAMGPFMAIYSIYKNGGVSKKVDMDNDAYWILAIGGVGIGVGLLLYGYKIMRAIGVKLAVITPSRGFAIELGAAIVIIIGSYLGLPLSTTHCQVGATTGVALLEGKDGVNYWVLMKTVIGWVITLIVVGFTTGLVVAQGLWSPISGAPNDVGSIQYRFLSEECPDFVASSYDYLEFPGADCKLNCTTCA
mmetsp:Transcript_5884/g.13694  ORF Transcript_5884/g.13694 Transcript_5884/m.13694 type:complete len:592 (-) Transcript_5884:85-1860(-)|eukprot:CAMPEP_0119397682 /NCGR_PEP_ID=MMETSP1334-20130426/140459_1 /TAXON_ID=127549 /ORGANISM="Calcidiscus leptoporus, Strain RCC1130" /LENGTH=591 /DNA_ID=CAMNT_0007421527 /DNA_START=46 /DNA_END=1821 /DNA_ORIENTATION=+